MQGIWGETRPNRKFNVHLTSLRKKIAQVGLAVELDKDAHDYFVTKASA